MDKPKRPEEIYAISGHTLNDNGEIVYLRLIKLKLVSYYYKETDSVYIPVSGTEEFLSDGKEFAYRETLSDEFIFRLPRFSMF